MADLNEMRAALTSELEAKQTEFRTARAALDKALEDAKAEQVDFIKDDAKFAELKEKYGDRVQTLSNELNALRERQGQVMDMAVAAGQFVEPETRQTPIQTRGGGKRQDVVLKRLTDSPEWKAIKDSIHLSGSAGALGLRPVEIMTAEETEAMLEFRTAGDNVVTGGTATSAGAVILNDFLPGVVDRVPFAPNRLLDLIPKATTESDTIDYAVADAFTNNAAETAEATSGSTGVLSESAATWTRVQDPVELIGHYIPATTRALEDMGQLRSFLSDRLMGGLLNRVNKQVYDGNGTSPNISGITDRAGILSQALGTDSRSDAILKAVTAIRTGASVNDNLDPASLAVVLYPSDWQDIRLEKDANGNYIYGPPSGPVGFSIWGMNVVQEMSLSAGTGLVGAFNQCELFIRRGVTVSSTDSHDDWFISEMVAIKATMRCALAVYKPAAFANVTGI